MATVIVNPNPVFDRTVTLHELVPGAVMRTLDVELTAGGKGINVARVLRALGHAAPLLIPVGRDDADRYAALLAAEDADAELVPVAGPIRTANIFLEQTSDRVSVVNDAGFPMTSSDWAQVQSALLARIVPGDLVLIMGSFPPALDPSALATLVREVRAAGAETLLDVNPQWLAASLDAQPAVVTPNLDEAEATLRDAEATVMASHHDDETEVRARAEAAALALCARGVQRAIVTAGPAGVAMAHAGELTWIPAPRISPVSTVGAGDSFVGGLVAALSGSHPHGEDAWRNALAHGVAAAAASCEQVRAGGVDPARVDHLLSSLLAGVAQ